MVDFDAAAYVKFTYSRAGKNTAAGHLDDSLGSMDKAVSEAKTLQDSKLDHPVVNWLNKKGGIVGMIWPKWKDKENISNLGAGLSADSVELSAEAQDLGTESATEEVLEEAPETAPETLPPPPEQIGEGESAEQTGEG